MMAGNPSYWWSMHSDLRSSTVASDHHEEVTPNLFISQTHPFTSHLLQLPVQYLHAPSSTTSTTTTTTTSTSSSSSLLPFSSLLAHHHDYHGQDFPHSWSQLLLGGSASEHDEERLISPSLFQSTRLMSNAGTDVKEETSSPNNSNNKNNVNLYGYNQDEQEAEGVSSRPGAATSNNWSHTIPASSPKSCITSLSSTNTNILDFSTSKRSLQQPADCHQQTDRSNSECNSTGTGGVPSKKPKVQSSSNPPLKVRKEKLGDRITALHQLVSPFGKTDTASVLLEAIGYIRFLQAQIEALSSPYLGNNNASSTNQHSVHGDQRNCLFPDHPGQLLNDSSLKRRGAANQEGSNKDATKDLKSRGLCLVPMSCTQLVGSDNGADYWAPSQLGGGF